MTCCRPCPEHRERVDQHRDARPSGRRCRISDCRGWSPACLSRASARPTLLICGDELSQASRRGALRSTRPSSGSAASFTEQIGRPELTRAIRPRDRMNTPRSRPRSSEGGAAADASPVSGGLSCSGSMVSSSRQRSDHGVGLANVIQSAATGAYEPALERANHEHGSFSFLATSGERSLVQTWSRLACCSSQIWWCTNSERSDAQERGRDADRVPVGRRVHCHSTLTQPIFRVQHPARGEFMRYRPRVDLYRTAGKRWLDVTVACGVTASGRTADGGDRDHEPGRARAVASGIASSELDSTVNHSPC